MEITKAFLTRKFNEFNAQYFNNEIPMVNFTFSNTRRNLGMYTFRTHTIRITRYYASITEHDVEEILIHEMVHAWQRSTGHLDTGAHSSHGPQFYKKAYEINARSKGYFHVSRLTTLSQETKNGVKARVTNNHPMIMVKEHENSTRVMVGKVTEKSMSDGSWDWLYRKYPVVEAFYIDDCIADRFADCAISRSRYNYKYIEINDYEKNVKPHTKKIQILSVVIR